MMVSIITPLFNSEKFVTKTIESVLGQTYEDWEMFLVDDCSNDSSIDIVKSFVATDSRIKLVQLSENSGAAVARNAAIKLAQGRYIAFLDSDDVWLPNKLEKQLAFMELTGCVFSYSSYEKIDELGSVIGHIGVPDKLDYFDLLKTCSIGCLTAIYDTEYFGKIYMPLIRKRQDFGLWLKLLKKVDFAYGISETLGQYRVRTSSISANKVNTATFTWQLYREVEKLNLFKASYYFAHYAIKGVLRTKTPRLAKKLGVLE